MNSKKFKCPKCGMGNRIGLSEKVKAVQLGKVCNPKVFYRDGQYITQNSCDQCGFGKRKEERWDISKRIS